MKHRPVTCILVLLGALAPLAVSAQTPAADGGTLGFYRFPTLHNDVLVFAAEGDLWRVSASGGVAHRLTTHAAEERYPLISPDGATLAFSAQYEGPTEVYTMPVAGGRPTRRTYEASPSLPSAWAPDGRLVYETQEYSTLPHYQLMALDLTSNTRERIPLATATSASYDETGDDLFFVRPAFHNNVTKRYVGGTARDVWKFGTDMNEAIELTGDFDGESHSPMAWQGRVYHVTDRDGTMNLWSIDENGGDLRQHTRHSGWDVRNPRLQGGRIVYEAAADIWIYNIASASSARVPISLASDFDQLREKWDDNPMQNLSSARLHPQGESVVLTARGRTFVAPVHGGRIVQASAAQGVRYRHVMFMPDGETLIGLSDDSGEMEWKTIPADGVGERRQVTTGAEAEHSAGTVSPDGKWIAYDDTEADLWVVDIATGAKTLVSEGKNGVTTFSWAPDSRWLAFAEAADNTFYQLKLYNVATRERAVVTSDRVNSVFPDWDPEGDFLYFLSDRNLVSLVQDPWGPRQPEPVFDKQMEVYHVALRPGLRSPFSPDDELNSSEETGDAATTDEAASEGAPITIETSGLARRVKRVPIPAGNYSGLETNGKVLFFSGRDADGEGGTRLEAVAITNDDPKVVTVAERVARWELSGNGEKLLVQQAGNIAVIDARAAAAGSLAEHQVDLSNWAFAFDVREDWREIYRDLWRQERDWFYDRNMHGVDWEGVYDKYMALVQRVTTRDELNDVIGRVVGELSALHTSVSGGNLRSGDDSVSVPSLGARLVRTALGDRIDYIYQTDPDYPDEMSPLADPDLGISEGDVITAVNGRSVLEEVDIGALLRNQTRAVRLEVRGQGGATREVMVQPTTRGRALRYADWEYTRRMEVEQEGAGDIGYVHLQAMGGANLTEWYRQFYPVFDRQGLILDVRRNNGGNIDSIILEKLMRQAWMYFQSRSGVTSWNMQYAFRGHMVVLIDQNTASDGEVFADGFRRLGLGEVIGMRSWGGEIWLSNNTRASDNGLARTPQTGVFGPEGAWLIEQIGLIPDIEIDNLPHATFNGEDAQLEAAIRYLQQKIAEDPRAVPQPPAYPNRGFNYRAQDGAGTGGRGPGGG
ncbi:MAG: S41 family peptidase [Gemmatimonadetes bacterium]|nr:S41 family peptidase [Gemmatimonadota bacterium]MDA1103196.1 S41 family peptidase [Gemmatimonadota bacterium]